MTKIYTPDGVPAPLAAYSHGARVSSQARVIHSAGQIGRWDNDEPIPPTFKVRTPPSPRPGDSAGNQR